MVPADSRRISRVPRYSGAASALSADFRVRGFHPLRPAFPRRSPSPDCRLCRRSYNPGPRLATGPVWAGALSLATTRAIVVTFSSSGYLDVSVPRVRPRHAPGGRLLGRPGCPIRKSAPRSGYLPLRAAYRSLSRPSSPPRAKASFMCPSLLSLCFARHAAPLSRGARRRLGAAVRRAASCKVSLALVSFEILSLSVRLSTLSFAFFKLPSYQCPRPAGRLPWGGRAGVLGFVRRSPWQS